ncbi:MAG: hypothetical protein IPK32_21750 [Verrucomicrobiaceae bacterium]|nr:hypothetical protein [Verrucomicrobiaceae bacterium]
MTLVPAFVDMVPEVQLFPGEINRVSLYRKEVKVGERLQFKKMVLLMTDGVAELQELGVEPLPFETIGGMLS